MTTETKKLVTYWNFASQALEGLSEAERRRVASLWLAQVLGRVECWMSDERSRAVIGLLREHAIAPVSEERWLIARDAARGGQRTPSHHKNLAALAAAYAATYAHAQVRGWTYLYGDYEAGEPAYAAAIAAHAVACSTYPAWRAASNPMEAEEHSWQVERLHYLVSGREKGGIA